MTLYPTLTETGSLKKKKKIQVQGEIIPQPGKVDTSKFHLAKLQYTINVFAKFCNTKLLVFCI